MKSFCKLSFPFIAVFLLAIVFIPEKVAAQRYSTISIQTFYDELSPYGTWVHNPEYGYVWLPDVEPNFQPYATRGHWVMTPYGNTWVSDYAWGWAPFHYGRWYYDNYYGWAWVPGNEWGPAWVNWRTSNGYYGWAPLGPGMYIHMTIDIPINYWVFVPYGYIMSPRIYNYYVPRRRVVNVYHQSVVINNVYTTNNYTYISGPSRNEIERATRRRVVVREIDNASTPNRTVVNRNSVQIYRPTVTEAKKTARPDRVSTKSDISSRRDTNRSSVESDSYRSGTNSSAPARRGNSAGNTNQENNVRDRDAVNIRSRTSTREPIRSNSGREAEHNAEQYERRSAPVQRIEDSEGQQAEPQQRRSAPVQRNSENHRELEQRQYRIAQPEQREERQNSSVQRQGRQSQPTHRRQEIQYSQEPRQERQTAPVQRREEIYREPATRRDRQSAPAQRRQEVQTAPTQQRQEVQSPPAQRREQPQMQREAPSRKSTPQESPQRTPGRGRN